MRTTIFHYMERNIFILTTILIVIMGNVWKISKQD